MSPASEAGALAEARAAILPPPDDPRARPGAPPRVKIGVVNGLRGAAILAVIYHHLFSQFTGPQWSANAPLLPHALLANGWLGVNLFFVLSGFVLALPYLGAQRPVAVLPFYRKRARRLLPLFYLCTLISMTLVVVPESLTTLLRDALLLGSGLFVFSVDLWAPRYNPPLWSLGLEIWFSLLFPFLIVLARRVGVTVVALGVLAVALAVRMAGSDFPYPNPHINPVKDSVLGRLDDFMMGIVVCSIFVRRALPPSRRTLGVMFAAGVLLVYAACVLWNGVIVHTTSRAVVPYLNNLINVGFALVLLALLWMPHGRLTRVFENWPVQMLGMMCFSLYVWHPLAIFRIVNGDYSLARVLVFAVALLLLSAVTYRWVEFGHVADARSLLPVRRRD